MLAQIPLNLLSIQSCQFDLFWLLCWKFIAQFDEGGNAGASSNRNLWQWEAEDRGAEGAERMALDCYPRVLVQCSQV